MISKNMERQNENGDGSDFPEYNYDYLRSPSKDKLFC
jgi:hypothetical protein